VPGTPRVHADGDPGIHVRQPVRRRVERHRCGSECLLARASCAPVKSTARGSRGDFR
jgi:hypothetical protein